MSPSPSVFHLCCERFSFSEPLGPCVERVAAWGLLRPRASGGMRGWSKVRCYGDPSSVRACGVTTAGVDIPKLAAGVRHLLGPQGCAIVTQAELLLQRAQGESFPQAPNHDG